LTLSDLKIENARSKEQKQKSRELTSRQDFIMGHVKYHHHYGASLLATNKNIIIDRDKKKICLKDTKILERDPLGSSDSRARGRCILLHLTAKCLFRRYLGFRVP